MTKRYDGGRGMCGWGATRFFPIYWYFCPFRSRDKPIGVSALTAGF